MVSKSLDCVTPPPEASVDQTPFLETVNVHVTQTAAAALVEQTTGANCAPVIESKYRQSPPTTIDVISGHTAEDSATCASDPHVQDKGKYCKNLM